MDNVGHYRAADNEMVARYIEAYQNVCAIPSPVTARLLPIGDNHFIIESLWKSHDLVKMVNTAFSRSYFGFCNNETTEIISSVIHDDSFAHMVAYTKSGNMYAIIREDKSTNSRQIIELWSRTRKMKSFDVLESKKHGKIYDDGFLSAFVWNGAENILMYVAEKYKPKSVSFFKQSDCATDDEDSPSCTKGEEYVYHDNWGEEYTDKSHSVLCTLRLQTGEIRVLPILENEKISLCQPIWCHRNDSIIYFVGYFESPYRLGLKYCLNRLCRIYRYDFDSKEVDLISDERVNARCPRLSPDDEVLIYIQDEMNGPHRSCSQLMKYTIQSGVEVVVDVVKSSLDGAFPGIYTETLPDRCFSDNGRYVIFSSLWRSEKVILAVDLKTNAVQVVPVDPSFSSCTVLDVYDDMVIASMSAPNLEPFLIAGKLCLDNDFVTVSWIPLDSDTPFLINEIDWCVNVLNPSCVNDKYPDVDFENILMTPRNNSTTHPLILIPHGGPHSVFTASFDEYHVAFLKLGYAVCLVNYRGSIGFGQDSVHSLLGNIGMQDVSDVYLSLQCLREDTRFANSDVILFGGSHGGYIAAHLSAKYPKEFSACICRNPVIDIAGMLEGTDIPDWPWVECGLIDHYDYSLQDQHTMSEMWNKSPFKFVSMVVVPTLLLLGKLDRRVPYTQGLKYYRALKANGVSTRVHLYDDNHGLSTFTAKSDGFMQIMLWIYKHARN